MLPNISADVIEKQKILQPGNCVGFGGAFKLPMVIKMEMPNPAPNSNSCDVNNCWKMQDIREVLSESANSDNNTTSTGGSTTPPSSGGGESVASANTPVMENLSTQSQGENLNPALVGLVPMGTPMEGAGV
jgi:hypothetical protein